MQCCRVQLAPDQLYQGRSLCCLVVLSQSLDSSITPHLCLPNPCSSVDLPGPTWLKKWLGLLQVHEPSLGVSP